jgi:hypothetical protein
MRNATTRSDLDWCVLGAALVSPGKRAKETSACRQLRQRAIPHISRRRLQPPIPATRTTGLLVVIFRQSDSGCAFAGIFVLSGSAPAFIPLVSIRRDVRPAASRRSRSPRGGERSDFQAVLQGICAGSGAFASARPLDRSTSHASLRPDADVDGVCEHGSPVRSGALTEHAVEDLAQARSLFLRKVCDQRARDRIAVQHPVPWLAAPDELAGLRKSRKCRLYKIIPGRSRRSRLRQTSRSTRGDEPSGRHSAQKAADLGGNTARVVEPGMCPTASTRRSSRKEARGRRVSRCRQSPRGRPCRTHAGRGEGAFTTSTDSCSRSLANIARRLSTSAVSNKSQYSDARGASRND